MFGSLAWKIFRCFRRPLYALGALLCRSGNVEKPFAWCYSRAERRLLDTNRKTFGTETGKRCFILGCGPSMRDMDLSKLGQELCIGVNRFDLHPAIQQISPKYYCLSGDCWFDGSEYGNEVLRDISRKLPKTLFFIPFDHVRKVQTTANVIPPNQVRYFPQHGSLLNKVPRSVNFQEPVPSGGNIVQAALLLAMHLGCNPIYLLGVDHDSLATRSEYRHFFKDSTRHPTFKYFEKYTYYEKIRAALQTWEGHLTIQKYAQQHGVRIVNLTPNSFLDVFEMGNLADVVGTGKA